MKLWTLNVFTDHTGDKTMILENKYINPINLFRERIEEYSL